MEIKLSHEESENYFYNSLCNGHQIADYGLRIGHTSEHGYDEFKKAKATLVKEKKGTCIEDIWMQILRQGDKLILEDLENDGEYTSSITLADVHERVSKTPIRHLMNAINEEDDGDTADVILQTTFFENIIFG